MPERKVKVGSSVGLHARPATIFTQAAAKQPVKVTIAKASGGNAVDARSVLFVLGLDVRGGDEVVLAAEGDGADAALDAALDASELIAEGVLAIEMGADEIDIGKSIHPHPTLGESIGMAAEVAHGTCTDLPPVKKAG